jgi:hypothetical protein
MQQPVDRLLTDRLVAEADKVVQQLALALRQPQRHPLIPSTMTTTT